MDPEDIARANRFQLKKINRPQELADGLSGIQNIAAVRPGSFFQQEFYSNETKKNTAKKIRNTQTPNAVCSLSALDTSLEKIMDECIVSPMAGLPSRACTAVDKDSEGLEDELEAMLAERQNAGWLLLQPPQEDVMSHFFERHHRYWVLPI